MASSSKKEETDLFDLLKDIAKNWQIMVPCLILAGIIGVFVAMWIRPVYKVDALLQIESKNGKNVGMMAGLGNLFSTTSPAETEIELIMSRQIIGEAVEKMHLQYAATPISKINRILHQEGRMELSAFEVPWGKLPPDEDTGPWHAVVIDSTNYYLLDHHKKKVLTCTVSQTCKAPYAGDTVTINVFYMNAEPKQKFKLQKMELSQNGEKFLIKRNGQMKFYLRPMLKKKYQQIQLPGHLPGPRHKHPERNCDDLPAAERGTA